MELNMYLRGGGKKNWRKLGVGQGYNNKKTKNHTYWNQAGGKKPKGLKDI